MGATETCFTLLAIFAGKSRGQNNCSFGDYTMASQWGLYYGKPFGDHTMHPVRPRIQARNTTHILKFLCHLWPPKHARERPDSHCQLCLCKGHTAVTCIVCLSTYKTCLGGVGLNTTSGGHADTIDTMSNPPYPETEIPVTPTTHNTSLLPHTQPYSILNGLQSHTSNGSWRQGIKGEMTCTVYVALVWNIIYWIIIIMIIITTITIIII